MPKFLFVYHGGKRPETQADIDKAMAAWGKWMGDNAKALVNPGNPVGPLPPPASPTTAAQTRLRGFP